MTKFKPIRPDRYPVVLGNAKGAVRLESARVLRPGDHDLVEREVRFQKSVAMLLYVIAHAPELKYVVVKSKRLK